MCGIFGVFNFTDEDVSNQRLSSANDCLVHRGPDSGNIFIKKNVGLAHRRLSIIDLSDIANQPMLSSDSRYAIVFNGEIYNYKELGIELTEDYGIGFKSTSDTEVVLEAFINWGVESFKRLNGMFALAIYDTVKKQLTVARDRFGIKPFYYFKSDERFVFSSEISALKNYLGDLSLNELDPQALGEYAWFGNPLGENTFFNEIKELLPAHFVNISKLAVQFEKFWTASEIKDDVSLTEEKVVKQVATLLENSVKRHLISDVPVGIFLSGGIDSSALTAFATKHYQGKIKTYSVGFDFDKGINELPKARLVAQKFDTEHQEVFIEGKNLPDIIEHLVDAHGEPFGDAADIPLYLLTKEVEKDVKVVLQGDGGDEIFGGYSRYFTLTKENYFKPWKLLSSLPWQLLSDTSIRQKVRFLDAINANSEAERVALLLTMESNRFPPYEVFSENTKSILSSLDPFKRYKELNKKFQHKDIIQRLFNIDLACILPDTFLEKVDKSTMANSVEIRVPFLDNELVEFALSIPARLKVKNGVKKYLLKKALHNIIPDEILYGPKTGFGVPYSFWIQKPLLDYLKGNLNDSAVVKSGVFDHKRINKLIEKHAAGSGNYGFLLWKCLILAIWLKKNPQVALNK